MKMLRKCTNIYIFNNLIGCRYSSNVPLLIVPNAAIAEKDMENRCYTRLLVNKLDLSSSRAASIIRENPQIINADVNQVSETINILKKFRINTKHISKYPIAITIPSKILENYIIYLKEVGFQNISLDTLIRFRTIIKKPIYLFKDHKIIPEDVNVPERLFAYLDPKPDVFPSLKNFTESDSIAKVHENVFQQYLAWRLQVPLPKIQATFHMHESFKLKCFESLSELFKLLLDDIGFSTAKMLSNAYLCPVKPESIKNIINTHPTLGGVDMKHVFNRHPKLISIPIQNFDGILKHFKEFDIPDESIRKCFHVFTLSSKTVRRRLNDIRNVPEFEVLLRNPRIVKLVLNHNKAKSRLEHLKKLKVKCASIHVLCGPDLIFEKFLQEGNGKTRGFDVVKSLGMEFFTPHKEIREKLWINPHWCHVPLIAIQESLKYLLGKGFIKEDISPAPVILLYPREKLEEAFEEITKNAETNTKELSARQKLNLCMYFIEKKHHFSGDGIWQNSTNVEVSQELHHIK